MQPLDVAFYAPLKKYWREILTNWKKTSGRRLPSLTKDAFPVLLSKLQEKLEEGQRGSHNVMSGFSKTGLYPLDSSRPKERLPTRQMPEDVNNIVSDVIVNILKDMRAGDQTEKIARRKKLNVQPGKSVSANDISIPTSSGTQKKSKQLHHDEFCSADEVTEPIEVDHFSDISDDLPIISNDSSINFKKRSRNVIIPSDSEESRGKENMESEKFSDDCDDLPLSHFLFNDDKENVSEAKEDDWVIVEYEVKKRRIHFIGQIKNIIDSKLNVQFLKKSQRSSDGFIHPLVDDTDYVTPNMVVKILDPPSLKGTGRRTFYSFNIDLTLYHF